MDAIDYWVTVAIDYWLTVEGGEDEGPSAGDRTTSDPSGSGDRTTTTDPSKVAVASTLTTGTSFLTPQFRHVNEAAPYCVRPKRLI